MVGNGQVGNKGSSRKQPGRERGAGEIIGKGGMGREHSYTQRGNGQAWRGAKGGQGEWGLGGAPRQVSECKRQNTQTSVCETDSQTDRIH